MTRAELDELRKQANNAVWGFGKIAKPVITSQQYSTLQGIDREYADKYFDVIDPVVVTAPVPNPNYFADNCINIQ